MSENSIGLYQKIANIQKKIGKMKKDKKNPYFKSNYFDINSLLEHLQPLLEEQKLVVTQPLTAITSPVGDRPAITIIIQDLEGEEVEKYTTVLPDIQDPQKMGSCITYYRRYALQSLFCLQAEDDDGEKAVGRKKETKGNDIDF